MAIDGVQVGHAVVPSGVQPEPDASDGTRAWRCGRLATALTAEATGARGGVSAALNAAGDMERTAGANDKRVPLGLIKKGAGRGC